MRLVVWNVNRAAHRKMDALRELRPDIAVLPECSSPDLASAAPIYAGASGAWIGDNPSMGLAVLGFGAWNVTELPSAAGGKLALPVQVEGPTRFALLALWTQAPKYAVQALSAVRAHAALFREPTVVAGDLNSNPRLDGPRSPRHAELVRDLESRGLISAYHTHADEGHGGETRPTFFMRRKEPGYHLDYAFLPLAWKAGVRAVHVGERAKWSAWSDHMPLVVDVDPLGGAGPEIPAT